MNCFGGKKTDDGRKEHPKRRLPKHKGGAGAGASGPKKQQDDENASEDCRRDSLERPEVADHKTRKWMKTDPLKFPPSSYHKSLFKCNQPFIILTDALPDYDSFAQLEMKNDVRIKAMDFMLKPCYGIFRSVIATNSNVGELGIRMLHLSLFQRLWRLTKPSMRLLKSLQALENDCELQYGARKRAKLEVPIENQDFGALPEQKGPAKSEVPLDAASESQDFGALPEQKGPAKLVVPLDAASENQDFAAQEIVPEQEGALDLGAVESASSNESLLFACEKRLDEDDGGETGRGRMDLRLSVVSNSNLKWKEKFGIIDMVESERCACVVECKFVDDDKNAVYQGAGYACQEALKNISNLHFEPIYVLVQTKSKWTHGVLDVRGKIGVIRGKVDTATFPDFVQQDQVRFSHNRTSLHDLEMQLQDRTHFYRQHFSDCPDAVYPSREYVVGTLHICDEWHPLPDFTCVNGAMRNGVHLFYEGLFKMIIGNKVTKWEMEDLERAKKLKKDIRNELRELVFASVKL